MAETVLSVPLLGQQEPLWCWAAVSSALSHVSPTAPSQTPCAIASLVVPDADCCADAESCNFAASLTFAMDRAQIPFDTTPTLTADVLERQIVSRGMPIAAHIVDKAGNGGHYVIIVGWDPEAESVVVADPASSAGGIPAHRFRMPLDTLLNDYGSWGAFDEGYAIR